MQAFSQNTYTKEEDYMMWDLHRIRYEMEKEKLTAQEINSRGENVIKKYGLKNIRPYQPENELSK